MCAFTSRKIRPLPLREAAPRPERPGNRPVPSDCLRHPIGSGSLPCCLPASTQRLATDEKPMIMKGDLQKLLPKRTIIVGDPGDLVHIDWSSEWRP